MKKSSLLSLLTAAAIVTTSAGTFAAWDDLDDTKAINLTYGKPVTVAITNLTNPTDKLGGIDGVNEVSVQIPVAIKQDSAAYAGLTDKKITLTTDAPEGLTVVFNDGTNDLVGGVDNAPSDGKEYTAKITLKDPTTVISTPTSINVTATLAKQ